MPSSIEKQHIVCTPGTCGGKPRIEGTRIRVQDVVIWHEWQGRSPDEIVADFPHLTLGDVHAALAYYFDHLEEIRQQLDDDEKFVALMKAKWGPGPLEKKLQRMKDSRAPDAS
jgi:uncharacterized protein (DUF433 family)